MALYFVFFFASLRACIVPCMCVSLRYFLTADSEWWQLFLLKAVKCIEGVSSMRKYQTSLYHVRTMEGRPFEKWSHRHSLVQIWHMPWTSFFSKNNSCLSSWHASDVCLLLALHEPDSLWLCKLKATGLFHNFYIQLFTIALCLPAPLTHKCFLAASYLSMIVSATASQWHLHF